ncbi:MAG: flagellar basal-body rod protein FlgF [Alphaproteobacteria bacterium]|nr:flagellar basal-body rod protein FlgF [Alphaproteobacteria bacterium]
MDNPTYVALSRFAALPRQQDVIAHNIANAATPGFKAHQMRFAEHVIEQSRVTPPRGARQVAFAEDRATHADFSSGTLTRTGNPLDLAIQGEGFFVFDTPAGERYGRNGRFLLGPEGTLMSASGHPVLSQDGQPISIRPADTRITIAPDGSVSTESGPVGRLRLARFDNPQRLRAEGGGLWSSPVPALEVANPRVMQGMVEESNVQPVIEMTRMLEALREFQIVAQFVEREGERRTQAVERLTRKRG